MYTSVDISYYPLKNEFKPSIKNFISRLSSYDNLSVETNGMSTQVFGEYDELMYALTKEIKQTMEIPHSIFILKMVNADLQKHPKK